MKNICIAYAFAIAMIYPLFAVIGWSWLPGDWSWELRIVFATFAIMFWIAFWMKIESDRGVWL